MLFDIYLKGFAAGNPHGHRLDIPEIHIMKTTSVPQFEIFLSDDSCTGQNMKYLSLQRNFNTL